MYVNYIIVAVEAAVGGRYGAGMSGLVFADNLVGISVTPQ